MKRIPMSSLRLSILLMQCSNMSGFSEMVAGDRDLVFINPEEFGEEVTIEGKTVQIVIDDDTLKERQGGQDLAVAESATLFYVKADDLPKGLRPDMSININGREKLIDDIKTDMGISAVALRETITGRKG